MTEHAVPTTILVVDDEPPLLRLLARVLEKQGHAVLTAADGDEAINLFDRHRDAIGGVVLDIVIPPRGATEVFDHMVSARDDLALIVSSGDVPGSSMKTRMETHGAVFLRKPFLPKALIELVEARIGARRNSPGEPGRAS